MSWIEALVLGIIQGLTEFLPVSSSGHLEIGNAILGTNNEESLLFTVVVHGATVLSTIVVFYKDIINILSSVFRFKWDENTKYFAKIIISMVPIALIGVLFLEEVEAMFGQNLVLVGSALLVTASLLAFTYFSKPGNKNVGYFSALIIGIAQAIAVTPGMSRSGSTIATALLLKVDKEKAARFSFLMVLIPIILANAKSLMEGVPSSEGSIGAAPLIIGFFAAFISGLLACKAMIRIVKRGKLIYFAIYCAIVGLTAILFDLLK